MTSQSVCPTPKPRTAKLGVKPGMKVALGGEAEPGFQSELKAAGAVLVDRPAEAHLTILFVAAPAGLRRMPESPAFWIIYPKGVQTITQNDVLTQCRAAGFNDTKVMSFSSTHTGLRFIPLRRS